MYLSILIYVSHLLILNFRMSSTMVLCQQ